MSARKEREKRREERLQTQDDAEAQARRQRLVKLGSATAFLAIAVVAVLIVIGQSETDGGDTDLDGVAEVSAELGGIPQRGLVLGRPGAAVKLIEFGDLQCPVCKGYAEDILPEVIESKVRSGDATLEFRNFTIISQESVTAGAAAVAAGRQNRGWDFVELFYRNQGIEATGYVTDDFLRSIAEGAGVPNIEKWDEERASKGVLAEVSRTTAEAQRLGLSGTPSFTVEGPGASGQEVIGTPGSAADLEAAIDEAG